MERCSNVLDWKNQYCKNGHTTHSNLQIHCNPDQITHDIFHRTRTNNPNIYVEPQKTQNHQSNPEKQKLSRRHNSLGLQERLQRHSHQNSMVLVSKQTDRPMEQNRYLNAVLICIFTWIHLVTHSRAIHTYSFMRHLFKSFVHF